VKRAALEHIIRAAADITGEAEFIVIGSSAVLAQFPNAPDLMLRSNEADIYPPNAPEKSWDIEGSLGSGSQFHETFGISPMASGRRHRVCHVVGWIAPMFSRMRIPEARKRSVRRSMIWRHRKRLLAATRTATGSSRELLRS
jgi:hypothetical protein